MYTNMLFSLKILLTSSYFLYLCFLVYALNFSFGSDATNSISPKEKVQKLYLYSYSPSHSYFPNSAGSH